MLVTLTLEQLALLVLPHLLATLLDHAAHVASFFSFELSVACCLLRGSSRQSPVARTWF